ncbi:MAG: hypothetical protein LJE96_17690 [Deltaproteobacteria bacterium]|nr:hypothetical protein [Deltaproteobacteria bacterium]
MKYQQKNHLNIIDQDSVKRFEHCSVGVAEKGPLCGSQEGNPHQAESFFIFSDSLAQYPQNPQKGLNHHCPHGFLFAAEHLVADPVHEPFP